MTETAKLQHRIRFPGESPEYRAARDELLQAEVALRRQAEAVAALRRRLPLGGEVPEDYVFEGESGPVRLSELFEEDKDTLLLYSFMFSSAMARPCPMCTSFLDGLNGAARHLTQQVNLAVAARSPLPRIREFGNSRGWDRLRLLSAEGNTYNRDFHGEDEEGDQNPLLNVFVRRDGRVHHAYATELLFVDEEPGQHARHLDTAWALWNLLDFTPGGRGDDWYPSLSY